MEVLVSVVVAVFGFSRVGTFLTRAHGDVFLPIEVECFRVDVVVAVVVTVCGVSNVRPVYQLLYTGPYSQRGDVAEVLLVY